MALRLGIKHRTGEHLAFHNDVPGTARVGRQIPGGLRDRYALTAIRTHATEPPRLATKLMPCVVKYVTQSPATGVREIDTFSPGECNDCATYERLTQHSESREEGAAWSN